MSSNMGRQTASAAHGHNGSIGGSAGIVSRTICPACDKKMIPGISHGDKCSRRKQAMRNEGLL
tara:strand:+ start:8947 stop:9135 length:189 start_codon:yes stop_codon:yes gene_type:complete